jgi:hypothetical protein
MSKDNDRSPAAKAMDEAIDLAVEGDSPYPERAAFVDADVATAGLEIKRFADEGTPIVLVAADGSARVLTPGTAIP